MTTHNTMKEIIETSLFNSSSIYKTRFSVLSHYFSTLGNGISLEKGYLFSDVEVVNNLSEEKRLEIFTKKHERIFQSIGVDINSEFALESFKENLEESTHYLENYNKEPDFPCLYGWTNTENYQPFREFINCKNKGFEEEMCYFYKTIKDFNVEEFLNEIKRTTAKKDARKLSETISRINNLKEWQKNLHVLRDVFPFLSMKEKINKF
jgi:hypothetical protein